MKALRFSVTVPKFIAAKGLASIFGRRVYYQGPLKTIKIADIPEPTLPMKDWVKVKTIYCGFCGSDLNLIQLHDSPTASPFTSFPCVIGHEIVGEIIETGSDVNEYKSGDIVAINPVLACEARKISPLCPSCSSDRSSNCENFAEGDLSPGMFTGINNGVIGGFAPYLVAHKTQLFRVPKGLSLEAAAMTEPLAVALQSIFDNMPNKDEKALVIGGGVIGNLIVQSIRALVPGCKIFVIEPSSFAAKFAMKVGADEIISSKDVFEETSRITGAKIYKPMLGMEIAMGGFNRIYDTVGHSSTLNLSMRLMSAMGTLSVVGIGGDVKLDLTPLWLKLQKIQGVYSYGMVTYNGKKRHVFDIALELMIENDIQADILVTHKFDMAEYRRMIEVNMNKEKHHAVKTVMAFNE
jgi:(R,R)-butanediol dehydrogenase / meso-butanediol dehydrogenase / diacetyl reductase